MDRSYREQVEELVVLTNPDGTRAAAEFFIRGEYLKTDEGLPEAAGQKYWLRVGAFFEIKEGKITRLNKWLESRGQSLQDFESSWFYSDSHNDLPLMKMVENPVAVNPDAQLKSHAEAHDWPVISLR
jgi:hypothetical protein